MPGSPGGGLAPRRVVKSEPIKELEKIVQPVAIVDTQADFSHNQTTIGTEAVQLIAASTPCKKGVLVKALSTNSGIVYVGKTGVTTGTGYELTAGEVVMIEADNVNKVYGIASAADQKVCWIGV